MPLARYMPVGEWEWEGKKGEVPLSTREEGVLRVEGRGKFSSALGTQKKSPWLLYPWHSLSPPVALFGASTFAHFEVLVPPMVIINQGAAEL